MEREVKMKEKPVVEKEEMYICPNKECDKSESICPHKSKHIRNSDCEDNPNIISSCPKSCIPFTPAEESKEDKSCENCDIYNTSRNQCDLPPDYTCYKFEYWQPLKPPDFEKWKDLKMKEFDALLDRNCILFVSPYDKDNQSNNAENREVIKEFLSTALEEARKK
jgi:hypothetical protein